MILLLAWRIAPGVMSVNFRQQGWVGWRALVPLSDRYGDQTLLVVWILASP